jgi:hypothetical protein
MQKKLFLLLIPALLSIGAQQECDAKSSDDIQRENQEHLLKEGTAQTGMPAIKNFRERKLLKDILELRDQDGLATYTYLYSDFQGKLVFLCNSIGYGIPYATQYTNPAKWIGNGVTLPQADPNALFFPSSAEGTWVMCSDGQRVRPVYIEPRVVVSPFKLN